MANRVPPLVVMPRPGISAVSAAPSTRRIGTIGMLTRLPGPITLGDPAAGAPLIGSQHGNMFRDGADPDTAWYLPEFRLAADPDASFGFVATRQAGTVDENGDAVNQAKLTLTLTKAVPDDVRAAQQARPQATFREIPLTAVTGDFRAAYTAAGGRDAVLAIPAIVDLEGDSLDLVVPGIVGRDAIVAYSALKNTDDVSFALDLSFDAVEVTTASNASAALRVLPEFFAIRAVVPAPGVSMRADTVARSIAPRVGFATATSIRAREPFAVDSGEVPAPTVTRRVTTITSEVDLGTKYALSAYAPSYTLTIDSLTRTIVSVADLKGFDVRQSEYIELTELGDISTRYPSLRALYLAQFTGTVVAIPAAYGIVRSSAGCFARCDAVLDVGGQSANGCRFQFSFQLGPLIQPSEIARLTDELAADPILGKRVTGVALPSDLDSDTPSTLTTPFSSGSNYGTAQQPGQFVLQIAVDDDDVPAVTKANIIYGSLCRAASPPSLLGRVAVKLDDAYPNPVVADVILNLHATSGTDDVGLDVSDAGSIAVVNRGPLDLHLLGFSSADDGVLTSLDVDVEPGVSVPISMTMPTDRVIIDRTLALPVTVPTESVRAYVAVNTSQVQLVHHLLGINATGIDFVALGITDIDAVISLDPTSQLGLQNVSLGPARQVATTGVDVPVDVAITGLDSDVALTVTGGDPATIARAVTLHHDFVAAPILVLTPDLLAAH